MATWSTRQLPGGRLGAYEQPYPAADREVELVVTRLETQFGSLARALASASERDRRTVVLHACQICARSLTPTESARLLAVVNQEPAGDVDRSSLEDFELLQDDAERSYFLELEATEDAPTSSSTTLDLFRRARALSAVCFALRGDSASDVLYETLMSIADESERKSLAADFERLLTSTDRTRSGT